MTDKNEKNTKTGSTVVIQGKVISVKMKDTAVVSVDRFVKHRKYGKYLTVSKHYKVHDPNNSLKEGDKVSIVECKPISKDKHFKIMENVNIKMQNDN